MPKRRLVVVGNGMAGARSVEEMIARCGSLRTALEAIRCRFKNDHEGEKAGRIRNDLNSSRLPVFKPGLRPGPREVRFATSSHENGRRPGELSLRP